jgi:heptosyltransferase-2
MRGRYLIRNPRVALGMGLVDRAINAVPSRCPPIPRDPECILVANWAHLGDLLTTLPAIDWLRRRYPQAEIGLLAGSWSTPIAEAARGLVDRVHLVDHFALARTGSRAERLARHRESTRRARGEIRAAGYQVALDFYAFFPTAAPFLAGTKIPVRIGWSSGGLGGFNTHQAHRRPGGRHVIDQARDILGVLDPEGAPKAGELAPLWPGPLASVPVPLDDGRAYVVLQTGAGAAFKEWPTDRWITLARRLAEGGERVVLAGAGGREVARNVEIAAAVPGAIDLTGKLSFPAFVSLIAHCEALYGLDSIAGHVAAAFRRPSVIVSGGMTDPAEWGPLNPSATVVSAAAPCAPCNRSGCATMACLAAIEPGSVLAAGARRP